MQIKMVGMSRKEREEYADRTSPRAVGHATLIYAASAGLRGDVIDVGGGFAVGFGAVDPIRCPSSEHAGKGGAR